MTAFEKARIDAGLTIIQLSIELRCRAPLLKKWSAANL